MQKLQLPQPSPEAQTASQQLVAHIEQEISQSDGWISFARYMELALYTPRLGYYTGGAAKLGDAGDFITAPEISSLFGQALAHYAMQVLPQTENQLMEFGAGTGKLAADVLTELRQQGVQLDRYYIVELSGELRGRQEQMLKEFSEVVWLQQMPASFSGLVLGNEVLDAMPVQVVKKTALGWNEMGVGWQEGRLCWAEKPLADINLLQQIPDKEQLPIGYVTELHATAQGFVRSLGQMLYSGGAMLLIDYGFPATEYYLPQRDQGTLMCHYRHHAHPDPFYWPGLQDITAHVDFSAMQHAGESAGLQLLCYTSQAAFLLNAGIGELLLRTPPTDPLRYLPQANALQKLVSPAEMGELFKVLVMGKNVQLAGMRQDRSYRL